MPPRRVSDVSPETAAALSRGERETRDLVEGLAVDMASLFRVAVPGAGPDAAERVRTACALPISKRMRAIGEVCRSIIGPDAASVLGRHPSDTVRGWAAFAIGSDGDLDLADTLDAVRPLADDHHFAVREWAWLGVREAIVARPAEAIERLAVWAGEPSENLRRFASEVTRPRGVWSRHISVLKSSPELGEPVLGPLRADPSRYVQNSVGNWLNDASKTRPDWVRAVVDAWLAGEGTSNEATLAICRRGMRSIGKAESRDFFRPTP